MKARIFFPEGTYHSNWMLFHLNSNSTEQFEEIKDQENVDTMAEQVVRNFS